MLKKIFGPRVFPVTGQCKKPHKFHDLYFSPYVLNVMKQKRMRRTGHVARILDTRNAYRLSLTNPKTTDGFEDLDIDGR